MTRVPGEGGKPGARRPSEPLSFTLPLVVALAVGIGIGAAGLGFVRTGMLRSSLYADPLLREGGAALDWLGGWSPERRTIVQLQDEGFGLMLGVLLLLTLLLLGIALVNVVTLLVARGAARRPELALRAVLGASPLRLLRSLLREAAPRLLLGGALGLGLAAALARLLPATWPDATPPWRGFAADGWGPLAAVAGGVAVVAALAWLAPAGLARRRDLARFLTTGGRATAGSGELFVRNALAVVQVAASLVLLACAGLLVRGLAPAGEGPVGVDPGGDGVLVAQLSLPAADGAADRAAFYEEALSRLRLLPSVVDTSIATAGAWAGMGTVDPAHALTGNPAAPGWLRPVRYAAIGPAYFRTLGIEVVRGREFDAADGAGANVAVVSEAFVNRFRLAGDPVGKRLQLHELSLAGTWYTIVGVVADVRAPAIGVGSEPEPMLYLSALQHPPSAVGLAVRTRGDPADAAPAVLAALHAADPGARVAELSTLAEQLAALRAPLRWFGALFALMAAAALLLATSGLAGVMAYNVGRRTREIGVRIALGARGAQVVRMILGQGLRLTALGALLGLMGAAGMARLLQLRFQGTDPFDPLLFGGLALTLAAVALLASLGPARRAVSVDPQVALRAE